MIDFASSLGRGIKTFSPCAPTTVKILHIIHSANPANGGPIEGVKQLAAALIKLGAEVEVVSLDDPDAPWLQDFPMPIYALVPSYSSFGYSPRLIPWLKTHYRDYSVIVVNGLSRVDFQQSQHLARN